VRTEVQQLQGTGWSATGGSVDSVAAPKYNTPMTGEQLTFERLESSSPDQQIYRLKGPMVLGNMFAFHDAMRSASASTILDMTDVPYIDSAGLGVLTNSFVSHQKQGRKFVLAGVNKRVRTLFQITKLDQLFTVVPTVESALKAGA
jgi:anti-sigma B factor antagonist